MTHRLAYPLILAALAGGLMGCEVKTSSPDKPFRPVYLGIDTRLLDGDLVNFQVQMKGARGNADVARYGECAAAQYALIRGYYFARHLRTNVGQGRNGVWTGDAVYVISPALPRGLNTLDAEVTVQDCAENGIPTV